MKLKINQKIKIEFDSVPVPIKKIINEFLDIDDKTIQFFGSKSSDSRFEVEFEKDYVNLDKKSGKSYCNWANIFYFCEFPENLIDEYFEIEDVLFWDIISYKQKLSERFIDKHKNEVNWGHIYHIQNLSESFIEKHISKQKRYIQEYWHYICSYQKISENFIKKHADEIIVNDISMFQNLSEDFMEKNTHLISFNAISMSQNLSESFIERHIDEINWKNISCFQNLSEDFIEKYRDKVLWEKILENTKIELSDKFILKYKLLGYIE